MKEMEINGRLQEKLIQQETELLVWDVRLQQDTNGNGYVSGTEFSDNKTNQAKQVIAEQKQALSERKQAFAEQKFNKEHSLRQKLANKPKSTPKKGE